MDNQTYPTQNTATQYFARDFFVYDVDFLALAPGVSASQQFVVQADSDFLLTKLAYWGYNVTGAVNLTQNDQPNIKVMIQDTGSGRQLMSSAVPISALFGFGSLPFILPRQRLFASRSAVTVNITNSDAANTYNVSLAFIGEKAFK